MPVRATPSTAQYSAVAAFGVPQQGQMACCLSLPEGSFTRFVSDTSGFGGVFPGASLGDLEAGGGYRWHYLPVKAPGIGGDRPKRALEWEGRNGLAQP